MGKTAEITEREIMDSTLRNTLTIDDIHDLEQHKMFDIYLRRNGIKWVWEYMSFWKEDITKRKLAVIEFLMMYRYVINQKFL